MRKFIKTIMATSLGLAMMTASASAQSAAISNTGPGSDNSITSSNRTDISCRSTNDVEVSNRTDQDASTGNASVDGNTSGGNVTSGSASNSNTTSTSVTAANNCLGQTVTTTPPPTGGSGGGQTLGENTVAGGQGAGEAVLVASLPATGELSDAQYLAGASAGLSGLGLLGYAIRAYFQRKHMA